MLLRRLNISLLIVLCCVVILQPLYPVIVYQTNFNFIAKHLCINRDKPWMHCDGKCYLKKEFNNIFNDQQKHPEHLSLYNFKFSDFTDQLNIFSPPAPAAIKINYPKIDYNDYHFNFLQSIFRPPRLIS